MLQEATRALSHLDAEALEALERRASALRDSLAGGSLRGACGPEVRVRLNVFSDVVAATSRDLAILRRTCVAEQGQERYRTASKAEGGLRWAR